MNKFFNIIFDELGLIAGLTTIILVGHSAVIGLCLIAFYALKLF